MSVRLYNLITIFTLATAVLWGSVSSAAVRNVKIPVWEFRAWLKVAYCETHSDWTMVGSIYSGALGITNVNWLHYAPAWFPRSAGQSTPAQQIFVAARINKGFAVPDQHGCSGGW